MHLNRNRQQTNQWIKECFCHSHIDWSLNRIACFICMGRKLLPGFYSIWNIDFDLIWIHHNFVSFMIGSQFYEDWKYIRLTGFVLCTNIWPNKSYYLQFSCNVPGIIENFYNTLIITHSFSTRIIWVWGRWNEFTYCSETRERIIVHFALVKWIYSLIETFQLSTWHFYFLLGKVENSSPHIEVDWIPFYWKVNFGFSFPRNRRISQLINIFHRLSITSHGPFQRMCRIVAYGTCCLYILWQKFNLIWFI